MQSKIPSECQESRWQITLTAHKDCFTGDHRSKFVSGLSFSALLIMHGLLYTLCTPFLHSASRLPPRANNMVCKHKRDNNGSNTFVSVNVWKLSSPCSLLQESLENWRNQRTDLSNRHWSNKSEPNTANRYIMEPLEFTLQWDWKTIFTKNPWMKLWLIKVE